MTVITPPLNKLRQQRNSSVELFRILATFLVLIVHFNGWFIGGVSQFDYANISAFSIGQTVIEAVSVCCVNCFLLISGWYGLKLKLKTIWNINMLLICIYVPFYVIQCLYTGHFSLYSAGIRMAGILYESYFVQCYLMLIFLSPIFNAFVEKFGRQIAPYVLCLWGIEFVAELIGNSSLGFNKGYSVIHFSLIYLLAQTASLYQDELLRIKRKYWLYGYAVTVGLICFMHFVGIKWVWWYSNPIVILSAFCLFMPFLYKIYYKPWINWIAASTLAVYIMHTTEPVINMLIATDNYLLNNYPYWIYLPLTFVLIVLVFVAGIIYDKIRIYMISSYSDQLFRYLQSKIKVQI